TIEIGCGNNHDNISVSINGLNNRAAAGSIFHPVYQRLGVFESAVEFHHILRVRADEKTVKIRRLVLTQFVFKLLMHLIVHWRVHRQLISCVKCSNMTFWGYSKRWK